MHITLVCDGVLPAASYGGVERVVVWLAQEFLRDGHDVAVVAMPGSFVPGAEMIHITSASDAFSRVPKHTDVVHAHIVPQQSNFEHPTVVTIHGNVQAPQNCNLVYLSRDHAQRHGRETYVYNGVPADECYFSDKKSSRLLFFSRINRPGKNVIKAMDLALQHDFKLDIAGGRRIDLLMRSQVRREGAFRKAAAANFRFHGLVGGWEKAHLFANARALLFPIRWSEPFGLVVIEALLAGTPVVTTPFGAMPELVQEDIGFICDDDQAFADAFQSVGEISAARCREYAADTFSMRSCATGYLDLFERVMQGEKLP
jgi:glycosyltransferase involved in cell wall biosynthesis